MMNTDSQARMQVSGKVQGVWFRVFTKENADRLGLTGWVRNESDGSVRLVVRGKRELIKSLGSALERGPESAQVDSVSMEWCDSNDAWPSFEIRH